MKTRTILVALLGFLAMYGPSLAANELLVPDDYLTIQAAIDDANDGDTIIVSDGTYTGTGNKNLDFGGRAITVRSENGPEFTTIDCQNNGRGFYFHTDEDPYSAVAGLTITNGSTDYGAGIRCDESSPTIDNCIFKSNSAEYSGGGIYAGYCSPEVTNCTFEENRAGSNAGGMCNKDNDANISGCVFIGNYCDNYSADGGAMLNAVGTTATIENCLFVGNTAYESGGAIRNDRSSPTIINCTFTENSTLIGGAIHNAPYASPIITNCIFWSDSAVYYGGDEIDNNGDCHPTISYCDIEGGWNGPKVANRNGSSVINGGGNINADPCFVREPSLGGANDDYGDLRLLKDSLCIDAGTDAGVYTDINGNERPFDYPDVNNGSTFDIGAYEAIRFKFTATSDNRPDDTPGADPNNKDKWQHLLTQIRDANVGREPGMGEFHVICGDFDDPWTTHEDIQDCFDNNDVLWYPVVGNHERSTPYMGWIRDEYDTGHNDSRGPLKNFTNQDGPNGSVETTYSFDYGNAHFIVLNMYWNGNTTSGSDWALGFADVVDNLYEWLIEDLYSNTKPVVIVYGHAAAFPQYRHFADDGFITETPQNRDRFWKILNDRKVIAYFCGHTHFYYHKQVVSNDSSYYDWEPFTWQIDLGNAGNPSDVHIDWDLPDPDHDPDILTFIDVTVKDDSVQFSPWRGVDDEDFNEEYPWTVDIPVDTTAPKIESVDATDTNTIVVVFSEWVSAASANEPSNYLISSDSGDVNVADAVLDHDDLDPDYDYKRVTLTTSTELAAGTVYTLKVSNVKDMAGNFIECPSTETFMVVSGWTAYNDCIYESPPQYIADNVTTYNIGSDSPGPSSGLLKDILTGFNTPVTATLTESGGVTWQEDPSFGGQDCDSGTDADDIFGGITDMIGVTYYGSENWYVDLTFTDLDPNKTYTFATSSNRDKNDSDYTNRYSMYTISDADEYTNASSDGVIENSNSSVSFCTGYNTENGYIAKWTQISPGSDGDFKVRAEAHGSPYQTLKAYAFDVFMLKVDSSEPEITGFSPANGAVDTPTDVNLAVDVNDPNGEFMKVTFYGRKIEKDFTVIALPDTQKYVQYPANWLMYFEAQTNWIVAEQTYRNIVFVTHEGDIVDTYDSSQQWTDANNCMSVLDGNVPYGFAPGNHDIPTTLFNQFFPYTRYEGQSWYGGHYPDNNNDSSYQLFSNGGMDFIVLHLLYPPQDDEGFETYASTTLNWANLVLKAHPNRKAIITVHAMIDNSASFIRKGRQIWNALVMPNHNVYLVLCGHDSNEEDVTYYPVCGHDSHIALADYQGDGSGGSGYLRVMQFKPADDIIDVDTFSPYIAEHGPGSGYKTESDSDFDLFMPMDNEFKVIGTDFVDGNGTASILWADLDEKTEYEWFVKVTNSSGSVAMSPVVWSFKTDPPNGETTWKAFNDCIYQSDDQYIGDNVTTYGIGNGFSGSTSGELLDQSTGDGTGVTATLTQSGGVNWQPSTSGGGKDCDSGTDANDLFGGITDMLGVIYYGSTGWYVDLTFTNLDPNGTYVFATSANRDESNYADRYSKYTISDADHYTNASSSGVVVNSNSSVSYCTGDNTDNGYIAKWTQIKSGSDGDFKVRVEAHGSPYHTYKAYAFDVFMLEKVIE